MLHIEGYQEVQCLFSLLVTGEDELMGSDDDS